MHYESITKLAISLDLLESSANNPEIIMSSTLSREAVQPRSVIKKVRRGVYEILAKVSVSPEICNYRSLGSRIHALIDKLKCNNELQVLRRSFFLLRQCLSAAGPPGRLKLGDGIIDVRLNLLDPRTVRATRDELVGKRNDHINTFGLDHTLIQAGEDLRICLGLDSLVEVVDLAVSVAEIASRMHSDGYIIAAGEFNSVMVRIAPPNEEST